MCKCRFIPFFMLFMLFSNLFAGAAETEIASEIPAANESKTIIRQVQFTGLKKTKESFMQEEFRHFILQDATDDVLVRAETQLRMEGIFSEYTAVYTPTSNPDEVTLDITVKEKITFLPIPFAMYSNSTGFMAGAVVMDTNAFGIKNTIMGGGMFSPKMLVGMASYSKPPKGLVPGFSTFWQVGKRENEITNLESKTVHEYDSFSVGGTVGLNEKLGNYNSVSLKFGFDYINPDLDEPNELEKLAAGSVALSWNVSKADFNEFFLSMRGLEFGVKFGINNSSDDDKQFTKNFTYSGTFQKPIIPRLRVCANVAGLFGIDNPLLLYAGRAAGKVNILPGSFSTERIFGETLGLEFALLKMSFGVVSVYANYELVTARDFDEDYKFNHGFDFGGRLYLSKIAFPAIAVGGCYNVSEKEWQFAGSVGISF